MFAPAVGTSPASLQRYESGERSPDAEVLAKVCEVTGADPTWLLTGVGSPPAGVGPAEPDEGTS